MHCLKAKPIVEQIQDNIREMIRSGRIKPGHRFPPEAEFAKMFGVSRMTLNRALSGLESEQLMHRRQGRGTFVRQDACRGTILFVFPMVLLTQSASSPFFGILRRSLQERFSDSNFKTHFMLGDGEGDAFVKSLNVDSIIWRQAAVVITSGHYPVLENELIRNGINSVCMGELSPAFPSVCLDYFELGRRAVGYLLSQGYRRIGLISHADIPGRAKSNDDFDGFCRGLQDAGITPRTEWNIFSRASPIAEALRRIWALDEKPDAFFVSDDIKMLEVEKELASMGIRVPEDVAIISHATQGVELPFTLPLTKCSFSLKRLVCAVHGVVDRLLRGEKPPVQVLVRPALQHGGTTPPKVHHG